MTTLASPTLGGARSSIWRTEGNPDVKGPVHIFDVEQIWTFLEGEATIELDGETSTVGPGDTAVLPAHATRQITAGPEGYTAIVTAPADAHAWTPGDADTAAMLGTAANSAGPGERRNKIVPPWIA
jgi:quercetin dioxygenase-like cupin family protein